MTLAWVDVRLIEYISTDEGVEWVTMEEICDDFKAKKKLPKGSLIPADHGAILKIPSKSFCLPVSIEKSLTGQDCALRSRE